MGVGVNECGGVLDPGHMLPAVPALSVGESLEEMLTTGSATDAASDPGDASDSDAPNVLDDGNLIGVWTSWTELLNLPDLVVVSDEALRTTIYFVMSP